MKRNLALLAILSALLCFGMVPVMAQEEPPPPPPIDIESAAVEFIEPVELATDEDASVTLDRKVVISGGIFYGTSFGPYVTFDGEDAPAVVVDSESQVTAYVPTSVFGLVKVRVTNPDGDFDEIDVDL